MSFYSGFAEDYERVFPFREEVYRFLRAHAGEPGGKALDVGCGPGHYCGMFATDGYCVTGIDLDEAMITEACRRYPEVMFRCLDMRNVDVAGSGFRCIYSIGNVMAHLPQAELPGFLSKVFAMLEQGGCWIMQVMNWDALEGVDDYAFPAKSIDRRGSVATFLRRYDRISPESMMFSISLVQDGAALFDDQTTLYPVSVERYQRLHESAGFRSMEICADFVGSPLRKEPGTGLVMSFRKA